MSLLSVAGSSSLGNSFRISLTVFGRFCYCHLVIRQDHGFGSPHEPRQLPRVGFVLSYFYKSNFSCSLLVARQYSRFFY